MKRQSPVSAFEVSFKRACKQLFLEEMDQVVPLWEFVPLFELSCRARRPRDDRRFPVN